MGMYPLLMNGPGEVDSEGEEEVDEDDDEYAPGAYESSSESYDEDEDKEDEAAELAVEGGLVCPCNGAGSKVDHDGAGTSSGA
jgi:hypothetical protein